MAIAEASHHLPLRHLLSIHVEMDRPPRLIMEDLHKINPVYMDGARRQALLATILVAKLDLTLNLEPHD